MSTEVIIPIKDRKEIQLCVKSLLSSDQIEKIWICDGGSVQSDCISALKSLAYCDRVELLQFPIAGFNKSYLINRGILKTNAEYLLISDADILWNSEAIQLLEQGAASTKEIICSVEEVKETDPKSASLQREQYFYRITNQSDIAEVKILPRQQSIEKVRSGCGLICTQKKTLLRIGGYQEFFQGWGWEDQDLLMRAQLLGIEVLTVGSVTHISHGDAQRNQFFQSISPSNTRNRNIQFCLDYISNGNLFGSLLTLQIPKNEYRSLRVQSPEFQKYQMILKEIENS